MLEVTSNVENIIAQLNAYQKQLTAKERAVLQRLHELGVEYADMKLQHVVYDGEHDSYVLTEPEWIDETTLALSVQGQSITFIEFGTGLFYGDMHEKAGELGMVRGGYGLGRGATPPWTFNSDGRAITTTSPGSRLVHQGRRGDKYLTYGNPPNRVVYGAGKEMRNQIVEVAREVFNE